MRRVPLPSSPHTQVRMSRMHACVHVFWIVLSQAPNQSAWNVEPLGWVMPGMRSDARYQLLVLPSAAKAAITVISGRWIGWLAGHPPCLVIQPSPPVP